MPRSHLLHLLLAVCLFAAQALAAAHAAAHDPALDGKLAACEQCLLAHAGGAAPAAPAVPWLAVAPVPVAGLRRAAAAAAPLRLRPPPRAPPRSPKVGTTL